MTFHSRRLIHVGINYLTIPAPQVTHSSSLLFQQAVLANGLEFVRAENREKQLILTREVPSPLQIIVNVSGPEVGQIAIVAPHLKHSVEMFIKEAEASISAFTSVWSVPNRQIIKCDATIRELIETESQHAFQELWEKRLGQSAQALKVFGRQIRGGGLRFVMDPSPIENDPAQIDVKIESYLQDTSKIFVETQFNWPKASTPGAGEPFIAKNRINQVYNYISQEVHQFLSGA
mgnify:CR=1 FL=1